MIEANSTQKVISEVPRPLLLIGSALIVSGIIISIYVVLQVLQVYQDTNSNPFVANLVRELSGAELVKFSGQSILLGEASATTSSIALFAMLAWISFSLGISLIKAGAQIVSPVFRNELATLKQKLNELSQKSKYD